MFPDQDFENLNLAERMIPLLVPKFSTGYIATVSDIACECRETKGRVVIVTDTITGQQYLDRLHRYYVDVLRVDWPNDRIDTLANVRAGRMPYLLLIDLQRHAFHQFDAFGPLCRWGLVTVPQS